MRIHISAPQFDVTINYSNGNGVFRFSATDYNVALNIAGIIQEAGSLAQMVDSVGEKPGEQINVVDILMDAAREAERAEQAAKDAPAEADEDNWVDHYESWPHKTAPVTYGHGPFDARLRSGAVQTKWARDDLDWSVDPERPNPGDIIAWRPAQ